MAGRSPGVSQSQAAHSATSPGEYGQGQRQHCGDMASLSLTACHSTQSKEARSQVPFHPASLVPSAEGLRDVSRADMKPHRELEGAVARALHSPTRFEKSQ